MHIVHAFQYIKLHFNTFLLLCAIYPAIFFVKFCKFNYPLKFHPFILSGFAKIPHLLFTSMYLKGYLILTTCFL